jgi:HAD superfamily hydrolase (TIGR01509 family)
MSADVKPWPRAKPALLVIFDCDGVLVDSEILACEVQANALRAYGLTLSAADIARRFVGLSARDMRAALELELGAPLPGDHETRCGEELFRVFRRELKPVPGISDVVAGLAHCAVCVASSSSPDRIALALEVTSLDHLFAPHVFSSTLVERGKPAPDLFLYAAREMGFQPAQSIVVEDSVNGVKAARSAQMYSIGFVGGAHCEPDHATRLIEAGADRICRNAGELAQALAELTRAQA